MSKDTTNVKRRQIRKYFYYVYDIQRVTIFPIERISIK